MSGPIPGLPRITRRLCLPPVRRVLLVLLLVVGLVPSWYYEARPRWIQAVSLRFTPVALPPRAELARHLGAFELEGAWAITSRYSGLGGYSALLALPDGRLTAISDAGLPLTFSPPGAPPSRPKPGQMLPPGPVGRHGHDIEAAVRDSASGTIWLSREYDNAISRYDPSLRPAVTVRPAAMADWGDNAGGEAMARLGDGRFVVLREGASDFPAMRLHKALVFAGDPVRGGKPQAFTFEGPGEFAPTDMALLPDGRALILMRRLVWPFPLGFAGRIMIADPAAIRRGGIWRGTEVAKLSSTLPVDNFEGMAVAPRADGRVTVWLISDDNHAATQRTLLWKLAVDPARLP